VEHAAVMMCNPNCGALRRGKLDPRLAGPDCHNHTVENMDLILTLLKNSKSLHRTSPISSSPACSPMLNILNPSARNTSASNRLSWPRVKKGMPIFYDNPQGGGARDRSSMPSRL